MTPSALTRSPDTHSLRFVNLFCSSTKFRMQTLSRCRHFLQRGDRGMSVDISSAVRDTPYVLCRGTGPR